VYGHLLVLVSLQCYQVIFLVILLVIHLVIFFLSMVQVSESSAVAGCSCVWYLFCRYGDSLSCALPLEKEHSTCLELLLQLATRVYLLFLK
jgi:hypothetical protein